MPVLCTSHTRSGHILYSLIARVRSYMALVTASGAGPPLLQLYLIPKSASGPPGLWDAVSKMPPHTPIRRTNHTAMKYILVDTHIFFQFSIKIMTYLKKHSPLSLIIADTAGVENMASWPTISLDTCKEDRKLAIKQIKIFSIIYICMNYIHF